MVDHTKLIEMMLGHLKESDPTAYNEYSAIEEKKLTRVLFQNYRSNGKESTGLRLTSTGHRILCTMFEHWTVKLDLEAFNTHILVQCDQVFNLPYYLPLDKTHITLYDSNHAMMLKLHGGNLKSFLESTKKIQKLT